ncbi:MAG: ABC transporter ATP-binding protein [Roseiarcus sp.]|jgi:multiple sugar transport system ATP-binding protein
MSKAVLDVRGLKKGFGAKFALDRIDISVVEGEVLGLLGPTGAGKTTTLRCISGLHKPDAGTIRLAGSDVTHVSPMVRDIAVVFEGFNLLPTLSVYENIAFPLRSPLYRVPEAELRERVTRAAEDLRISHLLDRSTDQISGGERQRVAVARALVRRPKLFLLDEPLSSLDLKLREALENELRDMHRRRGQTLIYASHDFLSTAAVASRIAVIDKGRLLQTGKLAEIYADPAHRRVGELVGSPSMALLEAKIRDRTLSIDGYSKAWPLSALRLESLANGTDVTVGFWPEDIDLVMTEAPDFSPTTLWATDFRGRDQAVEVHFGANRVRKVISIRTDLARGQSCFVRLDPAKAFVFASPNGDRLRPEGRRGPGNGVAS